MSGHNGLVAGTAILLHLLVVPILPIVLVPTALYLFTSSLAAEFAFTMVWWFVVGVNGSRRRPSRRATRSSRRSATCEGDLFAA